MNALFDGWIRLSSGFCADCRGSPPGLLMGDKSTNFTQIATVKKRGDSSL